MALGAPGAERSAVVVAPDDETRVLLRGLLRLHRIRVVAETDEPRRGAELAQEHRPQLLVVEIGPLRPPLGDLVARSRHAVPGIRVVVVTSTGATSPGVPGLREADAVLIRPFRVQTFGEALQPPAA